MSRCCKAALSVLFPDMICLRTMPRTSSKSFWRPCGLLSSITMPPIPFRFAVCEKAAVQRQLDYIRTTKNACTVPTQNRYAELRKVMRIYNGAPELSADARIALAVKETGFAEKRLPSLLQSARLVNILSALYRQRKTKKRPTAPLRTSLSKIRPYPCSRKCCEVFTVTISAPLPIKSHLRISRFYLFPSAYVLIASAFSSPAPMQKLR